VKNGDPQPIKLAGEIFDRKRVEVEYPFIHEGRILGFADVCEIWAGERPQFSGGHPRTFYQVFEIKPRIYSVGAVIRQCKATEQLILKLKPHHFGASENLCTIVPVVPHDDPKIDLLKEMYSGKVWGWKGSTQE